MRRHSDKFQIKSIVANASTETFLQQVREFLPAYAALADERAGKEIAHLIPQGVKFGYGEKAAEEAIAYGGNAQAQNARPLRKLRNRREQQEVESGILKENIFSIGEYIQYPRAIFALSDNIHITLASALSVRSGSTSGSFA